MKFQVADRKGDCTVHGIVVVDADQRMFLLDLWRRQASAA
jgi:hypothetical protein